MRLTKGALITLLSALAASVAASSFAQTKEKRREQILVLSACPLVTVSCPEGTQMIYKATVTGGDPNVTPTFNWTISPNTITGGHGTDSVTVDARGVSYGVFRATVEVAGYVRNCSTLASCTVVIEPPIQPRKIDSTGTSGSKRRRRASTISPESCGMTRRPGGAWSATAAGEAGRARRGGVAPAHRNT